MIHLVRAIGAVIFAVGAMSVGAAEVVDFTRDVRPILFDKCVGCHGPRKQESGLRLDYRNGLLAGGDHGAAVIAGDVAGSRIITRVTGTDPDGPRMPFERDPLSAHEVELLRAWVEQGAVWPGSPQTPPRRRSEHWAFAAANRQAPPDVAQGDWPRNGIDTFILARLKAEGLAPSPEADRYTLIRRVYLDLLGLPPTPEEADAFVNDRSPDAYERVVDRALDSPAYGERWGRHWLDQARYADSNGYSIDSERTMWPYRDWVIASINTDMPFDQFTIEQIAGDLLPGATTGQLIATGFHRNTLVNLEGGTDAEQFRVEAVVDRVNTTSSVWLGLTVACAQCHTHKFDPVTQREYYQLYAFFNSTEDRNSIAPVISLTPAESAELAQVTKELAALRKELERLTEGDGRRSELEGSIKELAKTQKVLSRRLVTAMVMRELPEPRSTHVHIRGDFLRPGAEVTPDVPEVLPPLSIAGPLRGADPPSESQEGPGPRSGPADRLDLARWLVDPANPLTPRVTVNRIWMRFFGRGLVETENDFGTQGSPPSHPRLLDWLAAELVRTGWSMKRLHRLIVTSATYRQASRHRPELRELDAANRLLARQERLRVDAEIVRDAALAASGAMTHTIGGPSVHPPQPEGVYAFTQVKKHWPTEQGANRYRRTLYTFFYRSAPYPLLATFDAPDFQSTCTRRLRSNTPLQSLTVANDAAIFELAQHLAMRVMDEANDPRERMTRLFRLCLTRPPTDAEVERLLLYHALQVQRFSEEPSAAGQVAPAGPKITGGTPVPLAAWVAVARAVINTDEFLTRE